MLIFLQILTTVFQLSFVALIIWLYIRSRRLKKYQNELVANMQTTNTGRWFRVNLSRPAHFNTLRKILGFEAKGLLIDTPENVRVLALLSSGEKIDQTYTKDSLELQWLGNKKLASANIHWVSVGADEMKLMISADTGFYALTSREALADICRNIQPQFQLPEAAKTDFALEKNSASLGIVVGFFTLIAFALIDGIFLNQYSLISLGNAVWGIVFLSLASIPCYFFLTKNSVPSRESLSLSSLLAAGLLVAFVPGVMRIDQLLSTNGKQSYDYKLQLPAFLDPIDVTAPHLKFPRLKEYWAQFDDNSTHKFLLLHGPLGLWQADYSSLDEAARQFYSKKQDATKK
jgi:hypothetical protein